MWILLPEKNRVVAQCNTTLLVLIIFWTKNGFVYSFSVMLRCLIYKYEWILANIPFEQYEYVKSNSAFFCRSLWTNLFKFYGLEKKTKRRDNQFKLSHANCKCTIHTKQLRSMKWRVEFQVKFMRNKTLHLTISHVCRCEVNSHSIFYQRIN